MAEHAHIASIEALDEFRSRLIVYITKAGQALDEIADEVKRTRQWIETEQRLHWEAQIRTRQKRLEQAKQEMFSAQLSTLRESTTTNEMAVTRAKRALREAEEKLAILKKWLRAFPSMVEPLARKLDKMRNIVATDLPKAVAYLGQLQKTLQGYTEMIAPKEEGPQNNRPVTEEGGTA